MATWTINVKVTLELTSPLTSKRKQEILDGIGDDIRALPDYAGDITEAGAEIISESDEELITPCNSTDSGYKVGGTFTCSVGAPGIGKVVYRITRVDSTGVYGYVIESTVRELDPSETE